MKTLAILGDSYSTYEGFIPEGYASWYSPNGNAKPNDVESKEDTWWYPLLSKYDLKLLINSSYSGSTVCNSGYDGEDYSHCSFASRVRIDLDEKIEPDIIIVFGGTNDYWVPSPCGNMLFEGWKKGDLYKFAPAFCFVLDYLKRKHNRADIIHLLNDDITGEIRESIRNACRIYDVQNLELRGIDKENGHPNKKGMKQIRQQLCREILNAMDIRT